MTLLTIDPGKYHMAYALFRQGRLRDAGKLKSRKPDLYERSDYFFYSLPSGVERIVVEKMHVYPGERKVDPNILIDITGISMLIAGRYDVPVTWVPASEWKGQVPKKIHHARIMGWLTEKEREVLEGFGKTDLHDILDAVGMGQWYLR